MEFALFNFTDFATKGVKNFHVKNRAHSRARARTETQASLTLRPAGGKMQGVFFVCLFVLMISIVDSYSGGKEGLVHIFCAS